MIPNHCFNLYYGNQVRGNYNFTENFLRMTFPNAWDLSEDEDALIDTPEVEQTGDPMGGIIGGTIGGTCGYWQVAGLDKEDEK